MTENSPQTRDRKLRLIGPVSIAVGVVLIITIAVLVRPEPREVVTPPPAVAARPAPIAPPTPPEEEVIGRADLLRDLAERTAAYAAGDDVNSGDKPALAIGQRFVVRMPFGCDGPQARSGTAQAFYEFDPEARTVRLVARPGVWTTLPIIQQLPKSKIEAVEGFWVPHPWSPLETCRARKDIPVPVVPTPPAPPTLGLAQLFEAGASRVGRHGERPYEYVEKLGEGARPPLTQGYRLVLEGRFSTFPGGRPARCWSESPDHRPVCLYAVVLERVAFESGAGELITEWRE